MYTTINDLIAAIIRSDPSIAEDLGDVDGIAQVIRDNRDLFHRYEDIDDDTYRQLLAACYVACGVSEQDAERLVAN